MTTQKKSKETSLVMHCINCITIDILSASFPSCRNGILKYKESLLKNPRKNPNSHMTQGYGTYGQQFLILETLF